VTSRSVINPFFCPGTTECLGNQTPSIIHLKKLVNAHPISSVVSLACAQYCSC